MAVRTFTEQINDLYTTTWINMKDTVADQIFDATPFYYFLKENGGMEATTGGRQIEEPLQYAKNEQVQWITRGGTVPLNDYEHLTTTKWDWKYLTASIVRFGIEDQQNSGSKTKLMDIVTKKLANTQDSLVDELESKLFAAAAAGDEIDGLQLLVKDDPTSSTSIGGINQSTYTWWANKATNMTGESFATYGADRMRTLLNNTSNNKMSERPDIIVCGQTPYEYYEDSILEHYRVTSNKLADKGFETQQFKGIPMIWSPSCANTRMYFLNTKYIKFKYDPSMFFDMTEWKPIPNQVNDFAAQIALACSFTVSKRRCQGVLYNIDTA